MAMKAFLKKNGDVLVVSLDGNVDFESSEPFKENLEKVLQKNKIDKIVFDMKDLSFVGSSGIASFVEAMDELKDKTSARTKICNAKSEWKRVFNAFGTKNDEPVEDDFFESREKALKSFDN